MEYKTLSIILDVSIVFVFEDGTLFNFAVDYQTPSIGD